MHEEYKDVYVRVLRGPNPSTLVFCLHRESIVIDFAQTRPYRSQPLRFNKPDVVLICHHAHRSSEFEEFELACVGSQFEAPIGVQRCVVVGFNYKTQRAYIDWTKAGPPRALSEKPSEF